MQNARSASPAFDSIFLATASLFFLLFNLGTGSLASWDEAIYAQVALELVKSGNWFDFTWQGQPWVDKPCVTIWATAFFYNALGVSEQTARLFSALCGAGTVVVTYLLGRRLLGRWTALLGALALLSSIHFIRMARFGMTDMPLVFFVTLTLYCFWMGKEREGFWLWAGVFFGIAFLTKSFAALFAPAAVLIYVLWTGDWAFLKSRYFWLGLLAAAALILSWNVYVAMHYTEMYMNESLAKHFLGRTTKALEGHSGNWYFYIRTMLNKYRPWIIAGLAGLPFFLLTALRTRDRAYTFVTAWFLAVFVIITVMKTKLHWYVLPLYPALSLMAGWLLAKVIREKWSWIAWAGFFAVMAVHIFHSGAWGLDYSRDVKAIAPAVEAEVPEDGTVFLYDFHEQPAAIFYWQRKVKYLDDPAAVVKAREEYGKGFYVFVAEKDLGKLSEALPAGSFTVKGKAGDRLLIDSLAGNR